MKKRLLLIRHAQSLANSQGIVQGWLDSPLSELGHIQARRLSERVAAEFDVDKLFSSPLARASDTAGHLTHTLNLPLIHHDGLKERDLGPLSGLNKQQIKEQFPEVEMAWSNNLPRPHLNGAESNTPFAARVQQALDYVLNNMEPDSTATVVTHGGTLNRLLANCLKIEQAGYSFKFGNASLTIIEVYVASVKIALLNDTCHLGERHAQRPPAHPASHNPR